MEYYHSSMVDTTWSRLRFHPFPSVKFSINEDSDFTLRETTSGNQFEPALNPLFLHTQTAQSVHIETKSNGAVEKLKIYSSERNIFLLQAT